MNLAGIRTIIEQQNRIAELEQDAAELRQQLVETQEQMRAWMQGRGRGRGEIVHVPRSTAVVMWEPRRRKKKDQN